MVTAGGLERWWPDLKGIADARKLTATTTSSALSRRSACSLVAADVRVASSRDLNSGRHSAYEYVALVSHERCLETSSCLACGSSQSMSAFPARA
jgi:hypothetical protein